MRTVEVSWLVGLVTSSRGLSGSRVNRAGKQTGDSISKLNITKPAKKPYMSLNIPHTENTAETAICLQNVHFLLFLIELQFFSFLFYVGVQLIDSVMSVSSVQQSDSVIHKHGPVLSQIFSHLGYYRTQKSLPCVLQWVLVDYILNFFIGG